MSVEPATARIGVEVILTLSGTLQNTQISVQSPVVECCGACGALDSLNSFLLILGFRFEVFPPRRGHAFWYCLRTSDSAFYVGTSTLQFTQMGYAACEGSGLGWGK